MQFIPNSVCSMETEPHMSREQKRKMKKKERKREQRQLVAMTRNQQNSIIEEESNSFEKVEKPLTDQPLIVKAICEKCNKNKTRYICKDCKCSYCERVSFFLDICF